jgi:hypothetical protein
MITILVIGVGNIGALIACLLAAPKTYNWEKSLLLAQGIKLFDDEIK